jgi:hypothetical protein
LQDILRQRRVEIVRDRERPGAKAERTRTGLGRRDWPQLGNLAATADNDEVFPGFNPVQ